MPTVFDQLDIRFEYPENWSVEESAAPESEQVVVASPQTAFWHLSKLAPDIELEAGFDEALAALRTEYHDMEVELVEEELEGYRLVGYDVNFICLDLTNTCWLRGIQTPGGTYLLLCQAEDQEFETVAPVFRAMLASMLRNLS